MTQRGKLKASHGRSAVIELVRSQEKTSTESDHLSNSLEISDHPKEKGGRMRKRSG